MQTTHEIINPSSPSRLILLVEHAGALFPPETKRLGLTEDAFTTSLDFIKDIGVAEIARSLAERLNVTAVLGIYSRLVVDLNRAEDAKDLIVPAHATLCVPGNQKISAEERARRIAAYYRPFHDEIAQQSQRRTSPVFFTLHSYPDLLGRMQIKDKDAPLPEVDLLTVDDNLLARALSSSLEEAGINTQTNFPYDLRQVASGSIHHHAIERGHICAGIELRNTSFTRQGFKEKLTDALTTACAAVL